MSRLKLKLSVLLAIFLIFISSQVIAKQKTGNNKKSNKISFTAANSTYLDINNIMALQENNGFSDFNLIYGLEGLQWPGGSGMTAVFKSGFLWGGYVQGDPQVRIGGSTYNSGLQPGPILSNGQAADPNDQRWRIYRVRRDVYPGGPAVDLTEEAQLENIAPEALRSQYESDWTEWPAAGTSNNLGAPFTDVNHDGIYEPNIDIPGVSGADQTIYFVANDQDSNLTYSLYGTLPMGIEMHATYWAYAQAGELGDMYFKKYTLINRGYQHNTISNMFVSFWADPDLGYAGDDLPGTDSTLNLIYTYNGSPTDAMYYPMTPPTVGFNLLEGPIVPGLTNDSAFIYGRFIKGKKNLNMTSSYVSANGNPNYSDPPLGSSDGANQFYNFLNGDYGLTGLPFQDPQGHITKYVFPGDPVTNTGWTANQTIPPSDIRQGMSSGPFTFAPGDTQEVVFSEIVGQGTDYLHSVSEVKDKLYFYANEAYKNKNIIPAPTMPEFSVSNNSNAIQIQWDSNAESDSIFEGYNVYQLSSRFDTKENAKLIATFDKKDDIKSIYGFGIDSPELQQLGTDSGIQNNYIPAKDYIDNGPFIKGKNYYYAVTAYTFIPGNGFWSNTESVIQSKTISYNHNLPGPNNGDLVQATHITGQSDGVVTATIIDPTKLTGDQYKVTFHEEKYTLGSDGVWVDVTPAGKRMGKASDLTGSRLTNTAVWDGQKNKARLHYLVNIVSPGYDYCEGIKLTLPSGIAIDSIISPVSLNSSIATVIPYTFNRSTNTIFFGDSTRSKNGSFAGGEDIVLIVNSPTLPLITNYTMYDDGYQGTIVDVYGTDTINTIADQFVTQHQWNVTNITNGKVVLTNQTMYNGQDIYAPNNYFSQYQTYGPGGSSGSLIANVGTFGDSVFEGIRVDVNGSFVVPTTIDNLILNGNALTINASSGNYVVYDFTDFGYNGTAAASLSIYNGGVTVGATDINSLQQDYELRWTGVTGDTTINGHTVLITKSGGSYATIFGASNYSIANHPLNPNPGVTKSFLIRIPFEVWNTDKNEQVNLLVYDRNAGKTNDPTKDGFEVWNENDRVYVWVVNTKYSAAVIDPTSSIVADSATWNWIFFKSVFKTGDDIKIIYNNPLQVGADTFTFTIPGAVNSVKESANIIRDYSLSQNYPNPFNPTTTINYSIPKAGIVTIKIYDVLGREVRELIHEEKMPGNYTLNFNASRLASGVYFYRMQAGSFIETKKLILLK